MPLTCTCGTTLPDDARFCYRCGKPQREEDQEILPAGGRETTERVSPPPLPAAASAISNEPLNWSSLLAFRTSLLAAGMTTVLEMIPVLQLLGPLIGGYVSASLYQRRSGRPLTTGEGAKLGWWTAIINALFMTIVVIANFALLGSSYVEPLRESVRQLRDSSAQKEALQMLNDPQSLAVFVLVFWVFCFGGASLLSIAGGALGARLYRSKSV